MVPQRASEQHYSTMTEFDLSQLPVSELAARDCALFMWATSSHLPEAMRLAECWGFKYASKAFCWAKLNKNAEAKHYERLCRIDDGKSKDGDFQPLSHASNYFMGMGHSTRRNTEDCWLFTRGNPKRNGKGVRELIVSPIREHSRKPDETYDRIEALFSGDKAEPVSYTHLTLPTICSV